MKSALQTDEHILRKGAANLQRGIETVGGRLYLTNQRLIFEAHALNFQNGTSVICLGDIRSIEKCRTKFLNVIPLLPNSLAVFSGDGAEFRFVLFGRSAWEQAISMAQKLV